MWRKLALVVPCYNEAERFAPEAYAAALAARPDLSLVFVDDGSADDTRAVLTAFAQQQATPGRVAVHGLDVNQGKAEAVRQGVRHVGDYFPDADFVGYWDADLATPFAALDDFAAALEAQPHAKFLLGSRVRLMGRDIDRRTTRHFLGRVFATAASLVVDLPIYDTQCGAKIIERDLAQALFEEPFATAWIFDVELLSRFLRRVGRDQALRLVVEVPLHQWRDVAGSKVKSRDFVRAGLDLARVWRTHRDG